jgi:hypothetical protein
MAASIFMVFGGIVSDGSNVTIGGTLAAGATTVTGTVDATRYSAGGTLGLVTFGPAAVISLTVKGGIITAAS